jgi:outer membrane receptor for ferrienterochelin and colicins
MRNFTNALFFTSILSCFTAVAQQPVQDSISPQKLDEVVVTGQFEPQSLKKAVHNVRVITSEDIRRQAANNLADVLNQYLNITVRTNGSDGRSQVSMFGLDAQYFKILVDNVPLVSDTGLGNNADLTQINLDDVEQIEIIEGSMGVTHGANAVTGVLNIITKKTAKHKTEITATVQEETVGKEYDWFDEGRHIQALKVSHNFSPNWFATIGANRNDFAGFYDGQQGGDYSVNDGRRGYRWLPKQQLVANALVGYRKDDYRIFYKFDFYDENVDFYNPIVVPIDNYPFPETYYSKDKRYKTNRYVHHLNSYGTLFSQVIFNISLSHQKQQRDVENFNYHILSEEERDNITNTYLSKETLYSTGTFTNFFKDKKYDLQLGYEAVNERGFGSADAGLFLDENAQKTNVRQRLENYDAFLSAEYNFTERFSFRPGVRYSFQSKFDDQYAVSGGLRYLFDRGIEARASVGRSYRTPNFDELYTYFVDSNHDVQGNPDLSPEHSMSYEANARKTTYFASGAQLQNNLSVTFLDVDDRISLVLTEVTPLQRNKYMNIDAYKMWNISTSHQLNYKSFDVKLGFALIGVSQVIDLAALNTRSSDDYYYNFNVNTSIGYRIPKSNTQLALYYKYNGRYQQLVYTPDSNGNPDFVLSEIDAFGMMDASVRQPFFGNRLDVTIGARNLLDVTSVQFNQPGGNGIHTTSSANLLMGYGRSYFIKLTYNLNFN